MYKKMQNILIDVYSFYLTILIFHNPPQNDLRIHESQSFPSGRWASYTPHAGLKINVDLDMARQT